MSEIDNTKETVGRFLQDLEGADLIKFPNLELRQMLTESEHRAEIDVFSESAITRINQHHNKEKDKFIPKSEWTAFNKKITLNQMRENSEELKTYLKAIIDPGKIHPEVNELGTYLTNIYNALGYNGEQKKKMNQVFFKDFRNALSHLDYDISLDSITWRNRQVELTTWTNDYLLIVMLQMNATVETINEKVNEIKSQK